MKHEIRNGAAIVELAVFLPVYFLIVMATIETCRMMYLHQSLKIAAYECARVGIVRGMTESDLQTQCDSVLQGRGVRNYQLLTYPRALSSLGYGEILTATVSAPTADNSLVAPWFYKASLVKESVQIMVEHDGE